MHKPALWQFEPNQLLFVPLIVFIVWFSGLVMAECAGEDSSATLPETIVWPMLPGESLHQLAALFYPKNRVMQRRFISRTLELNRDLDREIRANTVFDQPSTLTIPELKALARHAPPFKAYKTASAPHLRMSYHIADVTETQLTPEMQAEYAALRQRNETLKQALGHLHERLAGMQENLAQLKVAALLSIQTKPLKMAEPKPAQQPAQIQLIPQLIQQAVTAEPIQKPIVGPLQKRVLIGQASIESVWMQTLIQFLMIVVALIVAIAGWVWIRKRLLRKIEHTTNDQINAIGHNASFRDISHSFYPTKPSMPEKVEDSTLSVEEFDSVVEEARLLVSMERPAQAISILLDHIGAQPKTSLPARLYLLDIYRSQGQQEEFTALAKRLHADFNVMTPHWDENKAVMVVAKSLEEFPHIVPQLTQSWADGKAEEYLASLLEDNREGERAGFSLEVLQEIMLLQVVWELRESIAD